MQLDKSKLDDIKIRTQQIKERTLRLSGHEKRSKLMLKIAKCANLEPMSFL
jgi:hypothetical protein